MVLAPNAELEVMDTQGEWYYVKYGSKKGYVRSDVVTVKGWHHVHPARRRDTTPP